jgi:hypothetical protein
MMVSVVIAPMGGTILLPVGSVTALDRLILVLPSGVDSDP